MRKCLLASIFIALIITRPALSADNNKGAQNPKDGFSALEHSSEGTVETVIDPLTIKLRDGRTIHLTGLDYPDYDPYTPGTLSVTAVNILRDFLKNQTVKISRTKDAKAGRITRMGHEVAHLTRKSDDIWVQGMIIALGLARVRTEKYNPEMVDAMYTLEQKARAEKLGLWSIEAFNIASPENVGGTIGSFQIVEGTVLSVSMKQNRIYLNFGNNWRKDFTATIPPGDRRAFNKMGMNPLDWNGKTIRVRGWVGSYNGPMIEIDHPQAVEIISSAAPETRQNNKPNEEKGPNKSKTMKEKPIFNKGDSLPGTINNTSNRLINGHN